MKHVRVLHIEDDHLDASALHRCLSCSEHTFKLDRAENLSAALERAHGSYDVVLLDLSLPDCYGPGALRRVREAYKSEPVIVVTGNIDQAQAEEFVLLGADDYLFKGELNSAGLWKSIIYSIRKKRLEKELQIQTHELRMATELEKRANSSKTEFLANVSHDLRTPLGVILGYSEILAQQEGLGKDALDYVHRIRGNCEVLVEMVNDLLDLSKVETGHLDINLHKLNFLAELSEGVNNHYFKAAEKGLDLIVEFHSAVPKNIHSDRLRLRQILDNLLSNAVKFTSEGSITLSIGMENTDGRARLIFDVTDTGTGISERARETIFEPFRQADASINERYGGTGLGLALTRKLAKALGGVVTLERSEAGKGSRFRFVLPCDQETANDLIENPSAHFRLSINEAPPAERVRIRWNGGSVLLVEDNKDNQFLMQYYLEKCGLCVESAWNGEEAVKAARRKKFDVILMDMQMPVMTGYEAVRLLRESAYRGPVIALTAFAMSHERAACLDAGCDDYLSKPIRFRELTEKIDRFYRGELVEVAESPATVAHVEREDGTTELSEEFDSLPELKKIVDKFKNNLINYWRDLSEVAAREDWNGISAQAHSLRGASATFGCADIAKICELIEQEADSESLRNVELVNLHLKSLRLLCERGAKEMIA